MKIFLDAVGVDHAVVAQRDAALAVEKGDIAVEFQELASDGFARHLQMSDRPAAQQMLADDLVQVAVVLDAIEDAVGPDQQMGEMAGLGRIARAEATGAGYTNRIGIKPCVAEFFVERLVKRFWPLPAAARAAAGEDFILSEIFDRPVQHFFQHGPALQNVLGEDFVDGRAIDALIFDGHLAWDQDADDWLAAATARATGLMQQDVLAARGGDVFAKLVKNLAASGGVFAGGRADLDADRIARGLLAERFFGLMD